MAKKIRNLEKYQMKKIFVGGLNRSTKESKYPIVY